MYDFDSNLSTGKIREPANGRLSYFGGVGEIRTLEELLTPTRFPIVRARPTTRHLRIAQESLYELVSLVIIMPTYGKVKSYFSILPFFSVYAF